MGPRGIRVGVGVSALCGGRGRTGPGEKSSRILNGLAVTIMLLRTIAAVAASSALATVLAQRVAKRLLTKPSIPSSVDVPGCGAVAVFSQRSGGNLLVSLDWDRIFGKLPFKIPFCSAVVTEDGTIYVSGSVSARATAP